MKQLKEEQGFPIGSYAPGIHTVPSAVYIIGERKFAYDVWEIINTASRKESSGTWDEF